MDLDGFGAGLGHLGVPGASVSCLSDSWKFGGIFFLQPQASMARHYDKSSVLGPAVLGEVGWYDITVQKIKLGGQEFANFDCDPNTPGKQCIMEPWLGRWV